MAKSDSTLTTLQKATSSKRLKKWFKPRPARRSWIARHETLTLFPTAAYRHPLREAWVVPVHAWAYCEEVESLWRNELSRRLFAKRFPRVDEESQLRFRGRIWPFLVRNLKGRQVVIRPRFEGAGSHALGLTEANGHIQSHITVDSAEQPLNDELVLEALLPKKQKRKVITKVQLVPPTGVSVISDIDDTIKVTKVSIKSELLANTFYLPFKPITGMAAAYQRWQQQGVIFHYVSGTPYQLCPTLTAFFKQHRFPMGSVHLRNVRFRDRTVMNLFADPLDYKLPHVERLLNQYPQRQFILIGDLGEKDAEIYAQMAERYPQQVQQIWLRHVDPKGERNRELAAHLEYVFRHVPDTIWHTFSNGNELPDTLSQSRC